KYLFAICDGPEPPPDDLPNIESDAARSRRLLVLVAGNGGDKWIAWNDFLIALGGAVRSWRALGPDYETALITLAQNQLCEGQQGEPWRLFEEAVGDGLEFLFGRRVQRLGGAARGRKVPDLLAQSPDRRLLVVDAKASKDPFDASSPQLRPLAEYVNKQKVRQQGVIEVSSALIVASAFKQEIHALQEISGEFLTETQIPVAFLTAT